VTTRRYAEGTEVSTERSLADIRRLLTVAGATHFAFGEEPTKGLIQFTLNGLSYRFEIRRPAWDDLIDRYDAPGRVDQRRAIDAEWKRRWRARVLWLKALLEFAEVEPREFSRAMLAHLLLPNGQTLGSWAVPQIEVMYGEGKMPPLLSEGKS
jgi:hypothetical protein